MRPDPETVSAHRRSYFGTFSDPAAMARAVGAIDPGTVGPYPIRTVRKTFHGTFARATLDRLSIGIGCFAQGIPQTAGIANVHTFMFATEPAIVRRVSGWTLGWQQIFHFRPNEKTATSSPPGMPWAFGIIALPFDVLATQSRQMTGFDPDVPLNDDRMFQVPETAMARLIALMRDTARLARDAPWILETPKPVIALAGSIMETLLTCLTQGNLRQDRGALGRHRQIVARFEQALRECPEEMLSLSAICAATGVAQRTLNLACQEFLGQSAMHYARGRRLDLVRQTLLTSDPAETNVTGVAMHYGFWELGRFAQAYRIRFGERPSETLRRGAGQGRRMDRSIHAGIA
ncbi:AraC family transcriptional regulator [Azospirillum sp. YIM B02556]|uniref:AraC family transcriptional regulator n=1 Tax=Azospirillum endophyticum TaxID=2800326 RepID=A0ABS1FF00_9PROT|nr:helix-turn-helix domain-containing protein [Azospirillum endophyticum]MBK1841979.1 AraC family transcriptional regulator [Azospirillum endophyticum]